MNYWLMKSEPDTFSIDDLKKQPTSWDGVRNYQARNHMKNMSNGDQVFFYHSSCKKIGIVGIAQVIKEAYPDHTSWDPSSNYFDPKSSPENPKWFMVDIEFVRQFSTTLTLASLKENPELESMALLKKGNRLSVMPINEIEWHLINRQTQSN
ncbi:EVE domain-containing protein [Marinomonas sp. 2405UD68-3]|uniref:EVE domain-containing protein n=1 Tax=Marinomonas sp. 2405UD68-3 TaxID=3391835 RepID=UPI0039C92B9D